MADLGAIGLGLLTASANIRGAKVSGTVRDSGGAAVRQQVTLHLQSTGLLLDINYSRSDDGTYELISPMTNSTQAVFAVCLRGTEKALVFDNITPIN